MRVLLPRARRLNLEVKKMSLDDLRRARKAAADKMGKAADALAELEADEGSADEIAAAVAAFDAAEAEFNEANDSVGRAERVEKAKAQAAVGGDDEGAPKVPAAASNPDDAGVDVGLMVLALAAKKGERDKAAQFLDGAGHSAVAGELSGAEETTGGVLIPRAQSEAIVALLRPRVAVRALGAQSVPMPAGELREARQTGGANASYVGEGSAPGVSAPEFEAVDKSFKKLSALVPISNSLLRHATPAMGALARNDLLLTMQLREDLAFMRGPGGLEPKGLTKWVLDDMWLATVGTEAAAVDAVLRGCVSRVEDSDIPMVSPGWIMRASAKNFLASLKNAMGAPIYPTLSDPKPTLMGWPVATTSQAPNNLALDRAGEAIAGLDGTEVVFADFAEVFIGETMAITLGGSTDAAYQDAEGVWRSAYSEDKTLLRAVAEHDMAPRHERAVAGFNATGWAI